MSSGRPPLYFFILVCTGILFWGVFVDPSWFQGRAAVVALILGLAICFAIYDILYVDPKYLYQRKDVRKLAYRSPVYWFAISNSIFAGILGTMWIQGGAHIFLGCATILFVIGLLGSYIVRYRCMKYIDEHPLA